MLSHQFETIRRALQPDFGMGWNLLLALAPLAMALVLFRPGRRAGVLWWIGLVVFCLFLPNSAYTLTDVIHLVHRIRRQPYMPVWTVTLALIPQYAAFMFAGLEAHVLSLMLLGDYLRSRSRAAWVVPVECTLNFLASLGIFLGRFQRLNSWDVVNQPERVALDTITDFTKRYPLEAIAATFAVLSVLYYALKFVNRAILNAFPRRRSG